MGRFEGAVRQLTVANQLTFLRLAAAPAVAYALLTGLVGTAFVVFVLAVITDGLDGFAARRLGQQTRLGAILDPAADKMLMLIAYVILATPDHPRTFPDFFLAVHIPPWLALLVILRDVVIVVAFVAMVLAQGERSVAPNRIGKWAAAIIMITAGLHLMANVTSGVPAWLLSLSVMTCAVAVVVSGASYIIAVSRQSK